MAQRAQACITHQGQHFQHLLRTRYYAKSKSTLYSYVIRFSETIQCQCQISCVVIVFVVAFLPLHFHLLFISVDHGPEWVNFEFLNSQFQPVEIVFKCLGGLRLKIGRAKVKTKHDRAELTMRVL
jgi:hypothetical protein